MTNLFLTLFGLSVMGSIVILCVLLLNKVFRKNYSKRWLYIIWAVIAIRLIIPVHISIIDIPWSITYDENTIQSDNTSSSLNVSVDELISEIESSDLSAKDNKLGENIKVSDKDQMTEYRNDEAKEPRQKTIPEMAKAEFKEQIRVSKNRPIIALDSSILNIIAHVWLLGTVLVLLYHFGDYLVLRKKINRWSIRINNNEVLNQLEKIRWELNIKRKINIIECRQIQSPALVGFIKPCIVLPSMDFTAEQYYFILKHELIHYKHHDLCYKLILLLTSAMHWFNPFIHYMVYLANNDMELYCDESLVVQNDLVFRENYSKVLLQVIKGTTNKHNILLATGLGSKNRQLKNRFFQIMNSKPTKKGTCIILAVICFIALLGSLTAYFTPKSSKKPEIVDTPVAKLSLEKEMQDDNTENENIKKLESISNVLVVGVENLNSGDFFRADSILVVSVDPNKKAISLTSFLRDTYVEIPGYGKNKLMASYNYGGADLMKETIETNFDMPIDHTVTVNMEGFETIIDAIGGVEVELSKQEADYLNRTNYISNKQYRNVVEGRQRLNGNQALGYVRVRQVPTIDGETHDLGRTARLRGLLTAVIDECSKKDILELTEVVTNIIPNVNTDISLDKMLVYLNTLLEGNINTNTYRIPSDGTYNVIRQDGKDVMEINLDENKKLLQQIYN